MAQTILVYGLMFFSMLSCIWISNQLYKLNPKFSPIPFAATLIFAIFCGVRYDVGIDHLTYLDIYQTTKYMGDGYRLLSMEFGFQAITRFFASHGLHFSVYFAFLAFLQFFFIFASFREEYQIYPFLLFTFFFGGFIFSGMNGIRHSIAFCISLYSINFIAKRKFWPYMLTIFFAFSVHKSAVMLIPLYFIFSGRHNYFNKPRIQFILLAGALLIMTVHPLEWIMWLTEPLGRKLGYGTYFDMVLRGDTKFITLSRERGLGFLVILLSNTLIIYNSQRMKDYFTSRKVGIIYDLYFIGTLLYYIFSGILMFTRANFYFYNLNFIIGAFTLHYLYKNPDRRNNFNFISLILLYFIILFALLYRMEDGKLVFNFFWQS